ncbi:helix-turn-helix domain-containing protein [Mesorhizobium yinganensis]|uniref:helix-turn-helix domain-containing protein n=1 Tax=Mesorhizobium yinganensis TaxID=3157707 RepID=UPI0032B865E4
MTGGHFSHITFDSSITGRDLVELVLSRPIVSTGLVQDGLKVSKQGALNLVGELSLREMTSRRSRARELIEAELHDVEIAREKRIPRHSSMSSRSRLSCVSARESRYQFA